jgi:hypothetical protein
MVGAVTGQRQEWVRTHGEAADLLDRAPTQRVVVAVVAAVVFQEASHGSSLRTVQRRHGPDRQRRGEQPESAHRP